MSLSKTKQNAVKLEKAVKEFLEVNDVSYFFESEWRSRMLCLLFPSLDKTLCKLIYDMNNLSRLLREIELVKQKK